MDTTFLIIVCDVAIVVTVVIALVAIRMENRKTARAKAMLAQQAAAAAAQRAEAERKRRDNEAKARHFASMLEAYRQAEALGDKQLMETVFNGEYQGPLPSAKENGLWESIDPERLMVAELYGMKYCGNLANYEGSFRGVLKPVPTDYDPHGISVLCEDGRKLGTVATEDVESVRRFIGVDADDDRFSPVRIAGYIDCDDDGKPQTGRIYIPRT